MKNIDKMSERELRGELRETRGLLAAARCPEIGCLNGRINHKIGHNEWELQQCQWCADRSRLLAEGS